jgi:endonuclease/exonuclease/phosphatase family metal-dependent hydrolase
MIVLTFNTNGIFKSLKQHRIRNLFDIFTDLNADVLLLQEVFNPGKATRFFETLGYDKKKMISSPREGYFFVSRYPIFEYLMERFPKNKFYCQALFVVQVITPFGAIEFQNVHLSNGDYLTTEGDYYRTYELYCMLNYLPRVALHSRIIAGDFNSPSEYNPKNINPHSYLINHGFEDTTKQLKSTWIPSSDSKERIDRIYWRKCLNYTPTHIVDTRLIGPENYPEFEWPTGQDHRMVYTQFELNQSITLPIPIHDLNKKYQ